MTTTATRTRAAPGREMLDALADLVGRFPARDVPLDQLGELCDQVGAIVRRARSAVRRDQAPGEQTRNLWPGAGGGARVTSPTAAAASAATTPAPRSDARGVHQQVTRHDPTDQATTAIPRGTGLMTHPDQPAPPRDPRHGQHGPPPWHRNGHPVTLNGAGYGERYPTEDYAHRGPQPGPQDGQHRAYGTHPGVYADAPLGQREGHARHGMPQQQPPQQPPTAPPAPAARRGPGRRIAIGLVVVLGVLVLLAITARSQQQRAGVPTYSPPAAPAVASSSAPAPAPPPGPVTTFGNGQWRIGEHIAPGSYISTVPEGGLCYADVKQGDDYLVQEVANEGQTIVDATTEGAVFTSRGCGQWVPE